MKTLKLFCVALATILFIACNKENTPEGPQQEKYIEVDLACSGEILDVETSPLTKPTLTTSDIYTIYVYSIEEIILPEGGIHYTETPYATGTFMNSLQGVKIRLLEGKDYRFMVAVSIGGYELPDTREFNYSPSSYMSAPTIPYEFEGYYGELDKYTPVEGGSVTIETKRVSYGVNFIAEDLTEGKLSINVTSSCNPARSYNVELTAEAPTLERIYTFDNIQGAWRGIWIQQEGDDVGTYVNYYEDFNLTITWTKADGSVIPLGVFDVTFERNMKTTVRIKVEVAGSSNGITVVKENVSMVEDDKEYHISGGTVTEVPVNNA